MYVIGLTDEHRVVADGHNQYLLCDRFQLLRDKQRRVGIDVAGNLVDDEYRRPADEGTDEGQSLFLD